MSIRYGVVKKLTKDSIYISNNFNYNSALFNNEEYKTFGYLYTEISELFLLRIGNYTTKRITIDDFDLIPLETNKSQLIPSCWFILDIESGRTLLYRSFLTTNGYLGITEKQGKIVWDEGQ